ncbi:MAG: winged helix-turn-helix transcriptional regulator [Candidatus Thermoplasmatota archaeon]
MVEIDKKDRKILYQLDLNSRKSNTQIGKKVELTKDVVSYRIKKMQEEGIIKKFWTAIDTFNLGYNVFRIYINFQDVDSQIKNKIIDHFVNCGNTWAVISCTEPVDLDVVIWVDNIYKFYNFWSKTLDNFGRYFAKKTISVLVHASAFKKTFLLEEKKPDKRKYYDLKCTGRTNKIDKTDYGILNDLAMDARTSLVNLAEKYNCSSQKIKYRIKKLIDKDIIKAFRVDVDISKFSLQKFAIDINLKDHSKRRDIINYLKGKDYLEYIDTAIGWSDLEIEVIVENMDQLIDIMEKVDSKFPGAIRKQNFFVTKKYHKERWLPEFKI